LRQEAAKYKSNIEQAQKSDAYIAQKLGGVEHEISILAGDPVTRFLLIGIID